MQPVPVSHSITKVNSNIRGKLWQLLSTCLTENNLACLDHLLRLHVWTPEPLGRATLAFDSLEFIKKDRSSDGPVVTAEGGGGNAGAVGSTWSKALVVVAFESALVALAERADTADFPDLFPRKSIRRTSRPRTDNLVVLERREPGEDFFGDGNVAIPGTKSPGGRIFTWK